MQFKLIDGVLRVTAENAAEVVEVFKHYRLDKSDPDSLLAFAKAIQEGSYIHWVPANEKRPWHEVDVYLDRALEPYQKLLQYCTGYDGPIPDMNLTADVPDRLGYTHITDTAEIIDGMYHAEVIIQAEEWNNEAAEVRAQKNADDYVQERIGQRKHEPEFIVMNNGQYKHNPNYYLKRHAAQPGTGAPWLWHRIFAWWRAEIASEKQRAILDAVDVLRGNSRLDPEYEIRKGGGDEAHLVGYALCSLDPNGTCDWDGKGTKASVYKWEQFREMR